MNKKAVLLIGCIVLVLLLLFVDRRYKKQRLAPAGSSGTAPNYNQTTPATPGQNMQDISYCTYAPLQQNYLTLDIYYPATVGSAAPVVVYYHGGGIRNEKLSKSVISSESFFQPLLQAGYVVVSANYRPGPVAAFPAMVDDAKCAIRFLKVNAQKYHLNPGGVGVIGTSTGGYIVNMIGLADKSAGFDIGDYLDQSSKPQAVVDFFGPSDYLTWGQSATNGGPCPPGVTGFFGGDCSSSNLKKASPVTYISSDDPPFLILHGDKDQAVPIAQSQELNSKLQGVGVASTFIPVQNAPHGFTSISGGAFNPGINQINQDVVNFFDKYLK